MNSRYFKVDCDKEGLPQDETLVEIYSPSPLFTPLSTFSVGILVGVIITIIFK